ncbi:MAG: molybdopterin-binding protein [Nitrososphaeraceae archaeon]|jgi:nicotinamide-nucleotide amidase
MTLTFEILCIGNEILSGTIVNTNAHWLSKMITQAGGSVKRVTVAKDDVNEISSVIKESLAREPSWIIICGGLGPTYDDKTLEGLAVALHVDLILDNAAIEMMKESYSRYSSKHKLDETRLKMARIPKGSIPIQNPVGSAPSILIATYKKDNRIIISSFSSSSGTVAIADTMIVCLPGVPEEMKAIFLESILPKMKKMIGDFHFIETTHEITGVSEAMLAPTISMIVQSNPADLVYLKTHPLTFTNDSNKPKLRIQIVSKGRDRHEVQSRYNNIFNTIIDEIHRLNGKVFARKTLN